MPGRDHGSVRSFPETTEDTAGAVSLPRQLHREETTMQTMPKHSRFFMLPALLLLLLCPFATPVRANMPLNPQALQGAWAGSNGRDSIILMFMGSNCGMGLNGQQLYGMWNLVGNRINIQFQNGQSLSYTAALQGDTLVLDGNMRLNRQAMPNMPAVQQGGWGQPQQQPQGGGWGQPQQQAQGGGVQPPQPGFGSAPGPLEGRWVWVHSTPNRSMGFVFSGNRFSSWMPDRSATGTYTVSGGRLIMQHETGPDAGKTDNLAVEVQGNLLYIGVQPDNPPIVFARQ